MKRRIYVNMCCLAGLTILLTSVLLLSVFYGTISDQTKTEIENEVYYLSVASNAADDMIAFLDGTVQNAEHRITLIAPDGTVLYDSETDPAEMENHAERPEVKEAFSSGKGRSTRLSDTLENQTFYSAVRLENGMVIRLAGTTDSIFKATFRMIPTFLSIAFVIMCLALLLARQMTRYIVSPINKVDPKNPVKEDVYDELQPLLHRLEKQNAKIKAQMNDMLDQQEKIVTITENMSEGLILVDMETNILSINKSCKRLLMAPEAEYTGKRLILLNRSQQMIDAVKEALKGNTYSEILEINNKILQVYSSPVLEEEQIQGAVLFLLDVTEKQQAEKMRKEFSANVSHELKTPLTSISGYAELMKNNLVIPEDIPVFAEKIFKEAGRLIRLVNDIIKISQLDEKNIGIEKEEMNLSELVFATLENLKPIAQRNNITIETSVYPTKFYGVTQMIGEMIYNLCENAIKYNQENGNVKVQLYREEGFIHFKVSDTGIGISPDHQERIFERFYRVDKSHSKQTGGTGLGLAIVKHVVEYHDGYLEIHSKLNEGTTITAHIPEGKLHIS